MRLTAAALLILFAAEAHAGTIVFQFEYEVDGSVLGFLELTGDFPADETDVVSFTFTPLGASLLGYTPGLYPGTFDFHNRRFRLDGDGLKGEDNQGAEIFDLDPPDSQLHPNSGTRNFGFDAAHVPNRDSILSNPNTPLGANSDDRIQIDGDWRRVPEPSAACALVGLSIVGLGFRRRRRKCSK